MVPHFLRSKTDLDRSFFSPMVDMTEPAYIM